MDKENKILSLGKAKMTIRNDEEHIPSKVQADTLFNFMTQLEFLISSIKTSMLSPRYCDEDVSYLAIDGIKKIAIPMKCFCDINMHKLGEHLSWYGYYGLAFSKEWGMRKGIQPIQYINPYSELRKDFSQAFSSALKIKAARQTKAQREIKSFMLHEIMYYKPYSGNMENRNTKEVELKCFTDECEWRYVPNVTVKGFEQFYYDENILNAGILNDFSNAMAGIAEISLNFEYKDIKYIIVKSHSDFIKLTDELVALRLDSVIEREMISKIIVWDNSREDF